MWPLRKAWRAVKRVFGRKRKTAGKVRRRQKLGRQTAHLTVKKSVLEAKEDVKSNSTVYGSETFELADLPQYLSYVALYEEFRIDKIVYTFHSMVNTAPQFVNTGTVTTGMVHSIIDYNDSTAPTSIQGMMNDPSYRVTRGTKARHTRTIYPRYLMSTGAVGNPGKQARGWLTCEVGAVINATSHFGLKWAFEGGVNSAGNYTAMYIEPIITYYVSFRNPK